LIVTSGTLSPIDAFVNALGIDMRIIHSNNHVASSDQILCASITHSAEQRELLGVYEKRDDPEYHRGVGRIVARLCEIVPEGILIFFASYSKMFTCIQNWKKYIGNKNGKTIWEEMNMSKKLFEESKLKEGTNEAIRQYKLHVAQSNGAALLAVCRGKVINFSVVNHSDDPYSYISLTI
uniref:Regulator of telomere elongation helicase 1 homolog (inferred by orthology to a C. elegans protein) n=1 Tax=Anisakis simplex TaxID=6269 RepID=A0A0M3J4I3_ANISI